MAEAATTPQSGWAEWVSKDTKRELTPFQAKAVDVLCGGFGSPWNTPWRWSNVDWRYGRGVAVCTRATPSTYDFDQMTRLVIAAHEECVRVEISAASSTLLRIALHPRGREGRLMDRHPTIEEAIARFRSLRADAAKDAA